MAGDQFQLTEGNDDTVGLLWRLIVTLYDDLGVRPDASTAELRRAYRALARLLHPDLNATPGSDDRMRRINHAWTVLGQPAERERYDLTLRDAVSGTPGQVSRPEPPPPPIRWLRPSVLVIAVLTIIFIATAYAGHPGRSGHPPSASVPTTDAGSPAPAGQPASGLVNSAMVGQCVLILTGYDAIVPCTQRNNGLVVGQSSRSADCPAGTTVHQLAGRAQFVCLAGAVR